MEWIKRKPKIDYRKTDDVITKIAKIRGIEEYEIDDFLNPTEEELFDASEMRNAIKASKRIKKAIDENQNIVISIDPDVDGITSGVIAIRFLKNYTDNVEYIYQQREDGHGVYTQLKDTDESEREELNENNRNKVKNAELLIIVDSSSNDFKGIEKINELNNNLDIIILDHHQIEESEQNIDDYVLLVNPQHKDCDYPNKHLSGAGVVFKVMGLVNELMSIQNVNINQYSDLVAVGLVGDLMRVDILENRYLISNGLRNIKNVGITRILKGAKQNPNFVTSTTVGFSIAPIINGSARMGQIELAIEILLTDDDNVAKKLRLQMDKLNKQRREIQAELVNKYEKQVDTKDKIIIIYDENSNSGFNGLVAQDLSQKYQRPVFVLRDHGGFMSGSGRSYGGFDTQSLMLGLDYVEANGHSQAHGLSFPSEKLQEVKEYIVKNVKTIKAKEPVLYYDFEIEADEAFEYIEAIENFNYISGIGFPKITVKVTNITVSERSVIGKLNNTVKWDSIEGMNFIKFRVSEEYGSDVDLFDEMVAVGELQMNVFYNFKTRKTIRTPQLLLNDYRKV